MDSRLEASKREMVHLSVSHIVHGRRAKPNMPLPNNYAYWGGNAVREDRPNPVIITFDVKMLRERKVLPLQCDSYAVLSKHVLPPECIIRIEHTAGKRFTTGSTSGIRKWHTWRAAKSCRKKARQLLG